RSASWRAPPGGSRRGLGGDLLGAHRATEAARGEAVLAGLGGSPGERLIVGPERGRAGESCSALADVGELLGERARRCREKLAVLLALFEGPFREQGQHVAHSALKRRRLSRAGALRCQFSSPPKGFAAARVRAA